LVLLGLILFGLTLFGITNHKVDRESGKGIS
jgi:hypothetical protein